MKVAIRRVLPGRRGLLAAAAVDANCGAVLGTVRQD